MLENLAHGIKSVKHACAEFLQNRLTSDNVVGIRKLAVTLAVSSLITAAQNFIENNLKSVSQCEEFLSLSFDFILDLVKNDNLNIPEEHVFEAVMIWLKNDAENRSGHLAQLLAQIRLPLLSPQYLLDYVLSHEMIRNSIQCRDLVDEALKYKRMPKRRYLLTKTIN